MFEMILVPDERGQRYDKKIRFEVKKRKSKLRTGKVRDHQVQVDNREWTSVNRVMSTTFGVSVIITVEEEDILYLLIS